MFRRLYNKIIDARQEKVNREITQMLRKEYPGETDQYIYEQIVSKY